MSSHIFSSQFQIFIQSSAPPEHNFPSFNKIKAKTQFECPFKIFSHFLDQKSHILISQSLEQLAKYLLLHFTKQLTHKEWTLNFRIFLFFWLLISHKLILFLFVPLTILFSSISKKEKTYPSSFIVFSHYKLFIFHILIVLSYETVTILPEFSSFNEAILSSWASFDFIHLKLIVGFMLFLFEFWELSLFIIFILLLKFCFENEFKKYEFNFSIINPIKVP